MKIEIIKPLLPEDFIEKVKVDNTFIENDYAKYFLPQIENAVHFAVGPYFWVIPDNTKSNLATVSSNIGLHTPYSKANWKEAEIHLFANLIHPDDRLYVLSSMQIAMEVFMAMPKVKQKSIGLNIYGRMLNAKNQYTWRLLQFPGLYFNPENRIESVFLLITDVSHLGNITKSMMTVIDNSNETCQYYVIPQNGKQLVEANLPKISIRERQVIRLMASGLTSQEIAEKLNLAFYTIENHKRNLRAKTNTKSAAELMNFVLINNLL
jgi:DNA-binding CsgD family transcriptional regulator